MGTLADVIRWKESERLKEMQTAKTITDLVGTVIEQRNKNLLMELELGKTEESRRQWTAEQKVRERRATAAEVRAKGKVTGKVTESDIFEMVGDQIKAEQNIYKEKVASLMPDLGQEPDWNKRRKELLRIGYKDFGFTLPSGFEEITPKKDEIIDISLD